MSKHTQTAAAAAKPARSMTTKTLACCALLAALSVVFARLIVPMPNETTRFSIEAVPIFLAGTLFGPIAGGLVGFTADLVGCLFSGYGYNPLFCIPPILYGVAAGLCRFYIAKKPNLLRIALTFLPAILLGSILYQSAAFTLIYASPDARLPYFLLKLTTRGIQFAITWIIDAVLVFLLFRSKAFERVKLWPPKMKKEAETNS